jgi:hypothetical protein
MIFVGALLGTLTNTKVYITPSIALFGSLLAVLLQLSAQVILYFHPLPWIVSGKKVTIRRLGIRSTAATAGVIVLLWLPALLPRPEEDRRVKDFLFTSHKELYEKGAASASEVKSAYHKLSDVLRVKYGLTTNEIEDVERSFDASIEHLHNFLTETERLGNSNQIRLTRNLLNCVLQDRAFLSYHAERVRNYIKGVERLWENEDINSDSFKFQRDQLDKEVDELIESENELYFFITSYKKPVFDNWVQIFNLQFRNSLGLGSSEAAEDAMKELPEQIRAASEFKYEDKQYPYVLAEVRGMVTPNFQMLTSDDFIPRKNSHLKLGVISRYLSWMMENNPKFKMRLAKVK